MLDSCLVQGIHLSVNTQLLHCRFSTAHVKQWQTVRTLNCFVIGRRDVAAFLNDGYTSLTLRFTIFSRLACGAPLNVEWSARRQAGWISQETQRYVYGCADKSRDDAAADAGVVVLLKHPYPREVCEPGTYDAIKVHAQIGRVQSEPDRPRLSVSKLPLHTLCIDILKPPPMVGRK